MNTAQKLLVLAGLFRAPMAIVMKPMTEIEPAATLQAVGVTEASNKWHKYVWESSALEGNDKSISEGMAYQCQNPQKCATNADCGSALCVNIKTAGGEAKYCGCGEFERHFLLDTGKRESVQVCSCDYVKDSTGTCLPIWRNTIMCKFACKNCFNCEEKNEEWCLDDQTCNWDAETGCSTAPDETCAQHDNHEACTSEDTILCKWGYSDKELTTQKCMTRAEVLIQTEGASRNCPVGTTRERDSYLGSSGTFFDTCVPKDKAIDSCKFYEWDGESCKQCADDFRLGTMSSNRGDGRLIQNALCVKKLNEHNDNCAVFEYASNRKPIGENEHHHCQRCLDDYEWEREVDGAGRVEGKCVAINKTESTIPAALLGAGLVGAGLAAFAVQRGLAGLYKKDPETCLEE